jgi:uncharacterized protein with PQ loop repeat
VTLSSILGVVCLALGISFSWPQVLRVYRVKSVEGISPRGQLHGLSGCVLWTVYAYVKLIVPMMIANTFVLTSMILVTAALVRHRKMPLWHFLSVLTGFGAFGIGMSVVSPAIAGWFAIVIGATSILPQAVYVLRYANLSGVSVGMYGLMVVNGLAWTLYGIAINDILVCFPNFILLPCSLLIAVKAWRYQHRSAPVTAAEAELAST